MLGSYDERGGGATSARASAASPGTGASTRPPPYLDGHHADGARGLAPRRQVLVHGRVARGGIVAVAVALVAGGCARIGLAVQRAVRLAAAAVRACLLPVGRVSLLVVLVLVLVVVVAVVAVVAARCRSALTASDERAPDKARVS